jgi:serine/threonine-protein kinase HipA
MTVRLEAWLEGRHVGQFVKGDGLSRFIYDDDAPDTPISLSLPRDGAASLRAAQRFLDNLLPDEEHTKARMAEVYGAAGTDTFELLAKAGGDVAGGLVLLPEGETLPTGAASLDPALDRDVADRINSIKRDPDAWVPRDTPARFSLAGTQGKFALARLDSDWYWSNATVPSTHIVKPGAPKYRNLELAEVAALSLAADVGVAAPRTSVLHVYDQTAFLIERFDREVPKDGGLAQRLHAEDLAQALGVASTSKYHVPARQVVALLRSVDDNDRVVRTFLHQLVFNTLVGNADAHAKNYSVLLRPTSVSMAPIYDVIPIGLYPQFNQNLAMRIARARYPREITRNHWRRFAREVNFDPDEMVEIISDVATRVAAMNDTAWLSLDDAQAQLLRDTVARNVEVALTEPHATPPATGVTTCEAQPRVGPGSPSGGQFSRRRRSDPEVHLS